MSLWPVSQFLKHKKRRRKGFSTFLKPREGGVWWLFILIIPIAIQIVPKLSGLNKVKKRFTYPPIRTI
jgi:hypothetical protein